ncbi:MAG: Fpg/Nei family DNA glycosylase [Actinomycetota bacterium]|nr:Fpg/Nei family DNA glycosylase [Actinomycetota bacterium]
MPELPEMQALAERLDTAVAGTTFAGAVAYQFSALKTVVPGPDDLLGHVLSTVGRRGKFLVFEFAGDGGPGPGPRSEGRPGPRLLAHLSQGGRVDIEDPPKATKPKGAVVRLRFEDGPTVLVKEYGTERKAGWWVLAPGDEGPLASLGPEPFSDDFATLIAEGTDKRRIHTMLRDQRTVVGVGRGYADDILHLACLSPYATLAGLDPEERDRLVVATRAVLTDGLAAERKRSGGLPTKLGDHFTTHGRYGSPCPRCGTDLRRVSYDSYEVTYCPPCQTGGKVLADRRMSRLVR